MSVATARFPRSLRLLKPDEFKRVFQQNQCKSSDRFLSVLAVNNEKGSPRLGMAISIKNSGNAVYRNRLKRLIRESFRKHQHLLASQDIVVISRFGITARNNRQISSALARHWQSISEQCAN